MKRAAGLLSLALCLLLAGCMPLTAVLHPLDADYDMPLPGAQSVAPAVGDAVVGREVEATLYFPSADQQDLVPTRAAIAVPADATLAECLARALLDGPGPAGTRRLAPEGVSVLSVRQSEETVVVDLSIGARAVEDARQLFLMRAALVNTLCGAEGIDVADVLIAGRAESPFALPCGAGRAEASSPLTQWTQAQSESERAGDETLSFGRTAVLYFPACDGRHIVPQARDIVITGADALPALLAALADDGGLDAALRPALLPSDNPLVSGAEIVMLENGLRVARLTFDGNLSAILERARLSAWQMYAALTCTLTEFLPGLDGVQVYVGDGQLVRADTPEGDVAVENGVMTRAMFERMIGSLSTIYMTAADGSLKPLHRAVAAADALSPRMLLSPLFGGPEAWESGVSRVIPDGLSVDDLLGVRVEDGEAVLNLSAAFYAGCQRLTAQQERNLVYALVNTLTGRADVNAVRFQIEGETVETLVRDICLVGPLVRNPGLISAAQP